MVRIVEKYLRLLVAGALALVGSGASGQEPVDVLTLGCLGIVADAPESTVAVCTRLHPQLKPQLEDAQRKWEARNAADFRELKAVCRGRVQRAYGGNAAQIEAAKQQALRFQEAMIREVLADPAPDNRVNCRAYIEDFSRGGGRIDSLKDMIREVRDTPAKPVEWKP